MAIGQPAVAIGQPAVAVGQPAVSIGQPPLTNQLQSQSIPSSSSGAACRCGPGCRTAKVQHTFPPRRGLRHRSVSVFLQEKRHKLFTPFTPLLSQTLCDGWYPNGSAKVRDEERKISRCGDAPMKSIKHSWNSHLVSIQPIYNQPARPPTNTGTRRRK